MSQCIYLKDAEILELLINLNTDETADFVKAIERCLKDFSLSDERSYQPAPGIINRPTGQKTLFRPFTSPETVGTKIIVTPAPKANGERDPLHGILALCDNTGLPTGILGAEEITGYRTSMSAIIPFMWRKLVQRIVIFGAGKQALWHTRLALRLRGPEIDSIIYVNRSVPRVKGLADQLEREDREYWKSEAKLEYLTPTDSDYDSKLKDALAEADVIFCTVGSTTPLFPAHLAIKAKRSERQPLITAVGSWQPDMIEIDPDILRSVVDDADAFNPKAESGGVMLVDDREGALEHAGEVVQSKLDGSQVVELGELLAVKSGDTVWKQQQGSREVEQWLAQDLVLYKSIGVSATDLAAANVILSLAKQQNVGTTLS